jgi:hypothetical protein
MEILIWGDNMKRQVSVSIFLAIVLISLAWLYIKFSNETSPKENVITTENDVSKESSVPMSQEYISCKYYLKDEQGKLVVYENKNHEIYMETSIEIELLPESLKEALKTGVFFQTDAELYDFLESYSS